MTYGNGLARALVLALALLGAADPRAGALSGPILDEGTVVALRDVLTLPATAEAPPLARIGIVREAPDASGRLFVNDLRGPLYSVRAGRITIFLDMRERIPGFISSDLQLGLVSFALHPGFEVNGLLYTAHTEVAGTVPPNLVAAEPAPVIHHAVITEWTADDPHLDVFAGSSRELMRIAAPHPTHNLGEIGFEPGLSPSDPGHGLLYIAAGDFGSAQRRDSTQLQRLDTVFGALLRIDPLGGPFERDGIVFDYGVPEDNPFAGDGDPDTFGEIYAYGFRNPQNFHFDRERPGVLYVTDIGQGNLEEVNLPEPGTNHGWPLREGTYALDVTVDRERVFPLPGDDEDFAYPVAQYDHAEGIAIAGGLAVRNDPVSTLSNRFIFGDIVTGRLFYSHIDDLLAVRGSQPPVTATVYELHLTRDGAPTTLLEEVRANLGDASVERVDLRFSTDNRGRLLVTTKRDAAVRELVVLAAGPVQATSMTVPLPPGFLILLAGALAAVGRALRMVPA